MGKPMPTLRKLSPSACRLPHVWSCPRLRQSARCRLMLPCKPTGWQTVPPGGPPHAVMRAVQVQRSLSRSAVHKRHTTRRLHSLEDPHCPRYRIAPSQSLLVTSVNKSCPSAHLLHQHVREMLHANGTMSIQPSPAAGVIQQQRPQLARVDAVATCLRARDRQPQRVPHAAPRVDGHLQSEGQVCVWGGESRGG